MMGRDFVTIEGRAMVPALAMIAERVVEFRNTYPVLGMVRLSASGSYLTLRATDLDIEVTVTLDVIDVDEAGDWGICVDARILLKIARLAGSATLELDYDGTDAKHPRLTVRTGGATYDLDGLHTDTHPSINGNSGAAIETFAPRRLRDLIGKVSWCRSYEETRYYLNGVAWQFSQRGRRFVATDGHRLALCRYDDLPVAAETTRIIPNKTVDVLLELPGEIVLRNVLRPTSGAVDPLKLDAVAGNITVRSKLIEGAGSVGGYPDVDRVIPGENMRKAKFGTRRDVLLDAIARVMVFDDRHGAGRALAFRKAEQGHVTVGAKRPDSGGALVSLPDAWPDYGEDFGVNGRYLRDLVRSCAPGDLTLWQVDAGAPITVLDGDETMLRILMPMRV